MKLLVILFLVIFIQGCSIAVPVKRNFPIAPSTLLESCPQDLNVLVPGAKLSDVARTVSDNYTIYHQCAAKSKAWIEWYTKQKQIFEEVK